MGTKSHFEPGGRVSAIGNERGAALIIVLVMLLLLSILGVSMLATSTSELKIAGNYRNNEEAFYTAEAALELASVYSVIYTTIAPDSTIWPVKGSGKILGSDLVSDAANSDNHKNPNFGDYNRITFTGANGNPNEADVKVEYLYDGNPPAGSGIQEDSSIGTGSSGGYKANYYAISVIAYGPNDTSKKLESQTARIVPK
jgi:hypothetical protein